ncbi:NAD(P)-dependent dehydrogenase (short-subunit alcohol dehydrogenase family) [Rhizobium sp. BK529]|uniref:SDR family NAD(P)-dependent oxidoreductase n=1 Tax=unclassified Rhizobium TaxID=2613769 RepID=UPI00104DA5D8|nr:MULTISPECIES: SDR family NAD(P)-dependent oxidoreductase [unclassified Rhizobium]MBB3590870.1 NAD(P)-dependent dehydrogenase (short-subunit alcohol dehydrogenase family) [Rhizobium sp. BK529]TCS09175.1 NAD(P)-dependent dehydrogenase (short-subunit alcohol dehydrogenase family) [Rhizobium sp. BK418]
MDLKLDGKTALVTGSSKGIGEAIARGLAREGATVIVHGRDRGKTQRVAQEIVAEGGRAHPVTGDLTIDDEVERLIGEAQALAGRIDIVVNNAGGSGEPEDWTNSRPATWASAYDRNVLAAVRVTTRLLPAMREAGWGRIINISSLAGLMPPAGRPDYAACKAAINAMTSSMAKAVAAEGVTVNTISPGTIRSARLDARFREVAAERGIAEDAAWETIERAVLPLFAAVPLGRVGTLEEIADAVSFLASPRAGYITGVNLRIDGGMLPAI